MGNLLGGWMVDRVRVLVGSRRGTCWADRWSTESVLVGGCGIDAL